MQDWSIPLVVAAAAFLSVLVWRVRPSLGPRRLRAPAGALREARQRIESAQDDRARARALCDAAELVAKAVGGGGSATGFLLRAMRADPESVEVVQRATAALARRPRRLESLLWRHLASVPWSGASRGSARAALDALHTLYDGPLRNAVRARALAHARDVL